jgi:hypothetical protein
MTETRESYATTAAVFVGSLILFGPLTFAIFVGAATILTDFAGVASVMDGVAGNVVQIVAVLAAVEVVTEIADIQLHGFDALDRGSRRVRLGRHLLLAVTVLAALVVAVSFLVSTVQWSLAEGRQSYVAMAGLVALALAWAGARTVSAFRDGYGAGDAEV